MKNCNLTVIVSNVIKINIKLKNIALLSDDLILFKKKKIKKMNNKSFLAKTKTGKSG